MARLRGSTRRPPVFLLPCRSHFQTVDPAQLCISQIRFPHASGQVLQKSYRCFVALPGHQTLEKRPDVWTSLPCSWESCGELDTSSEERRVGKKRVSTCRTGC